MKTTLPPEEDARIAALDRLGALDTPRSTILDAIVSLTSVEVVAPLVRLDLVDRFRVVPKAVVGGPPSVLPRRDAFAAEVVRTGRVLIVPDLMRDERWKHHPDVHRGPGARMCIAMPLRTCEGEVVGALVAIDVLPRVPDPATIERMFLLTCQAAEQLHQERPKAPARPAQSPDAEVPAERDLQVVDGGRRTLASIWHESRDHVPHPAVDPVAFIGRHGFLTAFRGAWPALGVQPSVGMPVSSLVCAMHQKKVNRAVVEALSAGEATVRVALESGHPDAVSMTFIRRPMGGGGIGIYVHVHDPDIAELAAGLTHRLHHGVRPAPAEAPLVAL